MKRAVLIAVCFSALSLVQVPALSQTTGSVTGTVKDQTGAVIVGAVVTVANKATSETRTVITDASGSYSATLLPPGHYDVTVAAKDFATTTFDDVQVALTETALLNVDLALETLTTPSITVRAATSMVQMDGPQLGRVVDARSVVELPLATRNFTQMLALSPGTSVPLPNHTTIGHNSQNISVNGARVTQNNYQINGVDATTWANNSTGRMALPAPESIQEFKVNTSLYDATLGRFAGGNVQMVTKSGSNELHGAVYEDLQNNAFNANNPFLKAAGVRRPILQRNVGGGMAGGPVRKHQAFFFLSYQAVREKNAASNNSLSSSILIAPGLTDDRSEQTLLKTFNATTIHPIAFALLNAKLPNGHFLIPTPQANGRYSGSAPSTFSEEQFNTNVDYHPNERNSLASKFFFSVGRSNLSMFSGPNVPGFGADQEYDNRLASLQYVHVFGPSMINDARVGYNYIRNDSFPQEPFKDVDFGIQRSNAVAKPGLPLIQIAPLGGIAFGTATANIDTQRIVPSATAADTLSITHGKHSIRAGGEFRYYRDAISSHQNSVGGIVFSSFADFLAGKTFQSVLGTGIEERDWRATDYNVFVQEDWKIRPHLTLNLGLRYDLDLFPYDTQGRASTFDPALYKPRPSVDGNGNPVGPPIGGFVQAGNVIPQYDLPEVPNVTKRLVKSIDPNNIAPRFGFACAPKSDRLVVRAGYGIFYSRTSNFHLNSTIQLPPNYVVARENGRSFADPFPALPAKFPTFAPPIMLSNQVFDRNLRTPYLHKYSASVQYALGPNLLVEAAYVGTRGLDLFRVVRINQARLASPQRPIINDVTGEVITTNTPGNAQLRAPFQGVSTTNFGLNQTTAQSTYNSLQMSLTKRISKGLQFLASYTYAKSIDNTASSTISVGDGANDVAPFLGNQLDNRANRGQSNFDQTHRLVFSYLWDLPQPAFAAQSRARRWLLADWEVASIVVAASGVPIDVFDTMAGSLYGLDRGAGARPNSVPGIDPHHNVPAGYFFNPFAFVRPVVQPGQPIPSSGGTAIAGALGTDIGTVGRNTLRGSRQTNIDFSVIKRIRIAEGQTVEFHSEFFNLFNQVNFANPISNLNVATIDSNTGRILSPGDFGLITSTTNNPRLIQFALKFGF